MKQTSPLFLLMIVFMISACLPQMTTAPIAPEETQIPVIESPATEQPSGLKAYVNDTFGLGFQFPANWFGPEEYVSEQDLRVEVGSDRVYPYGTDPSERIYELKNSYNIVIQYSKNNQNEYWKDIYQSLLNLKDRESLSDERGLLLRVGQVNLGRFSGIEYISTLSETAQTSPFYVRQVVLFDEQSNLLVIMGQPDNVEIDNGENWRDIYRMIDGANLIVFHEIMNSVTVE